MGELGEQIGCRRGVIIVGDSQSGKSALISLVAHWLAQDYHRIYPGSMTMDSLYGSLHPETQHWVEGVLPMALRRVCWLVLDSSMQAHWLGPLDTLLSMGQLSLPNGETLCSENKVLLETDSLSHCPPSTLSRCGVVFLSTKDISKEHQATRMLVEMGVTDLFCLSTLKKYFVNCFDLFYDLLETDGGSRGQDVQSVSMVLRHFMAKVDLEAGEESLKTQLEYVYSTSLVWGLMGAHGIKHHMKMKMLFAETFRLVFVPECRSLMDLRLNDSLNAFLLWETTLGQSDGLFIDTVDTVRL